MKQLVLNEFTLFERINIVSKWILKLLDSENISLTEYCVNTVTGEFMIVSTWNSDNIIARINKRFKNPCIQPLSNGKTIIFHLLREQVKEDVVRLG